MSVFHVKVRLLQHRLLDFPLPVKLPRQFHQIPMDPPRVALSFPFCVLL